MISFIIPAYNAEKTIEKCIDSILHIQNYEIEVIIINDGSTDDTLNECLKIDDERVLVITQKNKGVSAARNRGILEARGDYVVFVDSDDEIDASEMEKALLKTDEKEEIILYNFIRKKDGAEAKDAPILLLFEVRRRHKGIPQFAKHRIVSFAATDCILPQDVVSLAERIASIYAKNGYITAYGIHADRFNVHIHFAVCAVSFQTQNMFHIQWKSEWKMLVTVTNQWKSEFDELLQKNIQMRQSKEAALYGDDIVRYGSVPITAKGQMNQNKKSKRK